MNLHFLDHTITQIKESIDHLLTSVGHNPLPGSITSIGLITFGLFKTVLMIGEPSPKLHPLQVISLVFGIIVAVLTALAIVKTHTTFFDKFKWIKKK